MSATARRRASPASIMLGVAVVLLSVIGVAASVARSVDTARTLAIEPDDRPVLTPLDVETMEQVRRLLGFEPGSRDDLMLREQVGRVAGRYMRTPIATLLHVMPAVLFALLVPLQFSKRIRTRYTWFHRWSGRVLLISAIPIGLAALFLGVIVPIYGVAEAIIIGLAGVLFFFSAARAYIAIRQRDIATHREWMIRMTAVALGVSTIRIVSVPIGPLFWPDLRTGTLVSFWTGWVLTIGIAEVWIRGSRKRAAVPVAARNTGENPAPVTS